MNTPAHAIINLLCLGRQDSTSILTPVLAGAVLPDLPIFIFYFVEKMLLGTSESQIWREAYYRPGWQNFIDLFNSIPLILLGLLLSIWVTSQFGALLFASMLLHIAGDLPLHHNDGHRHFFPFSDWRFVSPVSYWDPNHYGVLITRLEILTVLISCGILFQLYDSLPGKLCVGAIGLLYAVYFVYVLAVWA